MGVRKDFNYDQLLQFYSEFDLNGFNFRFSKAYVDGSSHDEQLMLTYDQRNEEQVTIKW